MAKTTSTLTWRVELTVTTNGLRDLVTYMPEGDEVTLAVLPSGKPERPHLVRLSYAGEMSKAQAKLRDVAETISTSKAEFD